MASENNKRIAKNTILLYCRQLISLFLALYTSRLTLEILGETNFGIYATVGGITALLSVVITSMSASTQRFMSFEIGKNNNDGINQVFTTSNQIHFLLAFVIILLGETIGLWYVNNYLNVSTDNLHVAKIVYQISLINCVLALVSVPYNALIISNERMGAYALFSIGDAILKFVGVVLLPFIAIDHLIAYAVLMCFVQLFSRIAMWIFCRCNFPKIKIMHLFNYSLFKQMFSIAGWSSLNSIAVTCYMQGSILTLNLFFGPIINAAYSIAMQAYSGLRQFCSSFQAASAPQIVKYYAAEAIEEMHNLLGIVCKMSFSLLYVLTFPIILTSSDIIGFWLVEVPPYAPIFFVWMVLYAYFDIFTYPLDIAAQASGKIAKYCIITSVITLSIVPVAVILFKLGFVPESILCVAFIAAILGCFVRIKLLTTSICLDFYKFIKNIIFRCVGCAVLSSIIPLYVWYSIPSGIHLRFLIILIVAFVSSVVGVWSFGLARYERDKIKIQIVKIIKKRQNRH